MSLGVVCGLPVCVSFVACVFVMFLFAALGSGFWFAFLDFWHVFGCCVWAALLCLFCCLCLCGVSVGSFGVWCLSCILAFGHVGIKSFSIIGHHSSFIIHPLSFIIFQHSPNRSLTVGVLAEFSLVPRIPKSWRRGPPRSNTAMPSGSLSLGSLSSGSLSSAKPPENSRKLCGASRELQEALGSLQRTQGSSGKLPKNSRKLWGTSRTL